MRTLLGTIAAIAMLTTWVAALWPQVPTPKPTDAKHASAEVQARILKLQLTESRIQSAFQSCSAQDFQGQFNHTELDKQGAVNDAFKEAGLDKKDYELNLDTFEFVKKAPVVAAPTVSPAAKP